MQTYSINGGKRHQYETSTVKKLPNLTNSKKKEMQKL